MRGNASDKITTTKLLDEIDRHIKLDNLCSGLEMFIRFSLISPMFKWGGEWGVWEAGSPDGASEAIPLQIKINTPN